MGEINYLSEYTLHAVPNVIIDTFHFPPTYKYPVSAADKQLNNLNLNFQGQGLNPPSLDGHGVYEIKYHVIWVTKYRYKVLKGPLAIRTRELIRQGCEAREIGIMQGSVGKKHIHLLLSSPPSLAPNKIAQYLKRRSARLLQDEFPELKKKYWGQHLWV